MSWKNIRLILRREMRDQLRDRRTLFMIAVLPLLFYPLLGASFFQIAQFLRKHPSRIMVVGHEQTGAELPSLIENGKLSSAVFDNPQDAELVELEFVPLGSLDFFHDKKWPEDGKLTEAMRAELNRELRQLMELRDCEGVVFFPPKFFSKLEKYTDDYQQLVAQGTHADKTLPAMPSPEFLFDNRTDKTRLAHGRVNHALDNWTEGIDKEVRKKAHLPPPPISVDPRPITHSAERINASLWSKVLPFVLMIWAVTGAFYPAVDLCAGEKERGTLETLLSSPARRTEIVMGKLFTVMIFSVATAVLNLLSMCLTGAVVISQLGQLAVQAEVGPPPLMAILWMCIILLPISALFSAVCLALAAFARSTKEGQYYLMPVILITMPLILLPMAPNIELNLGFSLIPISGIVLLMRSMMEGTFHELWPYAFPVAVVTLACCWLAVRWAVEQFSREDVLFREGERWDLNIWMKHLMRDREDTPTVALAVLAGVLILVVRFFLSGAIDFNRLGPTSFVLAQCVIIVATVLAPVLIMTFICTRSPRETLLLKRPSWLAIPLSGILALALLPMVVAFHALLMRIFDPNPAILKELARLQKPFDEAPFLLALMAFAVVPPLCEELAFRGFILSGFRQYGHKWRAVVASSFFFAVTHTIMFQTVNAFFVGLVLGYLAVQTRSIWPPMIYHCVHNGALLFGNTKDFRELGFKLHDSLFNTIIKNDLYAGLAIFFGTMIAVVIVFWFHEIQPRRRNRRGVSRDSFDADAEAAAVAG